METKVVDVVMVIMGVVEEEVVTPIPISSRGRPNSRATLMSERACSLIISSTIGAREGSQLSLITSTSRGRQARRQIRCSRITKTTQRRDHSPSNVAVHQLSNVGVEVAACSQVEWCRRPSSVSAQPASTPCAKLASFSAGNAASTCAATVSSSAKAASRSCARQGAPAIAKAPIVFEFNNEGHQLCP